MKTLYIDCAMGCAGDMLTAALLELHPDREGFIRRMNAVLNGKAVVSAVADKKCGIVGTHVSVLINGEEEGEHEHHHHEHDHEHGESCTCGCHDHDHDHEHHHHHADEVFTSWGMETAKTYTAEEIQTALEQLEDAEKYGMILRAKGIVAGADGKWIHFDYVPGTPDVRTGSASTTGRLCVIGSHIQEDALAALFRTC